MNDKDLAAFRETAVRSRASDNHMHQLFADILDAALEHIDQQAAYNQRDSDRIVELLDIIEVMHKNRIAASKSWIEIFNILKSTLVKERAFAIQNNPNRTYEWTYERAEKEAKIQLAFEMPEIF
jgi:hypothetical protein